MPLGKNNRPGFHESTHTYPEITIYQHIDDPVIISSEPNVGFSLNGRTAKDDKPSIISVHTHKDIGSVSGSFQITMKPSQATETLFKKLVDDDWIDIVFYINDSGYHVMRGLLDEIRRPRRVGGTGATAEMFTITGRDFGKVWESTPIWFSPFANDFVTSVLSLRVFSGVPEMWGSPGKAPLVFLKKFMEELTKVGGVNWAPPKNMPGINSTTFTGNINFQEGATFELAYTGLGESSLFQNIPKRQQYNPNGLNPSGMIWDLAREYSDPMFTELYTDLLPDGDPFSPRLSLGDPYSPLETKMAVVLRDKPFPFLPSSVPLGFKPTWEKLPTHTLTRQEIVEDDVGRSGFERYNAFFVAPRLLQEELGSHALYIIAPLMDLDSIKKHGFRRLDIQSNVSPDPLNPTIWGGPDISALAKYQRQLLRDWYCMNPYLLSGTIVTGHGRPDIHIGNKLTLRGNFLLDPLNVEDDETYYIESVDQDWQVGKGMRTTIGVTRGWVGNYTEYLWTLEKVAKRYTIPPMALSIA